MYLEILMLYLVYIDEFGHIGPYVDANHEQHKTHPVFGLAGFALPYDEVRNFSTFFYQLKNNLLKYELDQANVHPAKWEKKGSSLYTVKNVEKYQQLRHATNRLFNAIKKRNGFMIYVGIEKRHDIEMHQSHKLYQSVLRELIKRLDEECESSQSQFMLLLDQSDDVTRQGLIETASMSMFGTEPRRNLIEPPTQIESHLYQTIQCADWLCGIMGRLSKYWVDNQNFADYEIFERSFADRIAQISKRSGIRKLTYEK